jgi:hypothetical protein
MNPKEGFNKKAGKREITKTFVKMRAGGREKQAGRKSLLNPH